jgi:four helix bundle protein
MSPASKKKLSSYRELLVWQKAMDLVSASYAFARKLPQTEVFALSSQIRRAAVSIPANTVEGYGRWNLGEYAHHLRIASGSLTELETFFLIGLRLGYFSEAEIEKVLTGTDELGRMLMVLVQKLARRAN